MTISYTDSVQTGLHTESSESKVESDDNKMAERRQNASVVSISGSDVVAVGVYKQHNRKQGGVVHICHIHTVHQ